MARKASYTDVELFQAAATAKTLNGTLEDVVQTLFEGEPWVGDTSHDEFKTKLGSVYQRYNTLKNHLEESGLDDAVKAMEGLRRSPKSGGKKKDWSKINSEIGALASQFVAPNEGEDSDGQTE